MLNLYHLTDSKVLESQLEKEKFRMQTCSQVDIRHDIEIMVSINKELKKYVCNLYLKEDNKTVWISSGSHSKKVGASSTKL